MASTDDLNARQLRFALGVLEGKDATNAYIEAGYKARGHSAEQAASRLLRNIKVAEFLQNMRGQLQEESRITAHRVLEELANLAFANIGDYVKFGADGVTLKESDTLTAEQLAAVQVVSETPGQFGKSIKFKLYDKRAALVDLGKHLGIFGRDAERDEGEFNEWLEQLREAEERYGAG